MKKIIKILLILFIGFILGALFMITCRHDPFAYITINNVSSKNIQIVKIIDESNQNIQLIENIPDKKSENLKFYVAGEGAYQMEVIFEDNSTISGGAGYVETGYKIIENIKSDKIETDFNLNNVY